MIKKVNSFKRAYNTIVSGLGIPVEFIEKGNTTGVNMLCGIKTPGENEQQTINDYGAGVKLISFMSDSIHPIKPKKFDTIKLQNGEILTLAEVFPVFVRGETIGYKCYSVGNHLT